MSLRSAQPALVVAPQPARRFRIFISYASEDYQIADAISKCLTLALDSVFAEINIDKRFLQAGIEFKKQIQSSLEVTDVFIIVYTGAEKRSHGYTGWEVGYFDHVLRMSPTRIKVALYLGNPPAISAEDQGVALDIGHDKLRLTLDEFVSQLSVQPDDPMCELVAKWQESVDKLTTDLGYPVRERRPEQSPISCVTALKIGIFKYLKTTVELTLAPQKQITIKATGAALQRSDTDLPAEAEIIPSGAGGPMGIFGLSDTNTTWEKFLESTAESQYRDSWREAITSVIMSSFPDRINVDNSQLIVSSDDAKAYRVILATATKYYDDNREFNLYFVEALQKTQYGDRSTSLLLKGLELVCRFRFMFLEDTSQFSGGNTRVMSPDRIPEMASKLLRELNLLRKDSRDTGLDEPAVWRNFVSWEDLQKMAVEYRPREEQIRTIIGRIAKAKGQMDLIVPLQQELSKTLDELQEKVRPLNTLLLRQMTRKLHDLEPACSTQSAAVA